MCLLYWLDDVLYGSSLTDVDRIGVYRTKSEQGIVECGLHGGSTRLWIGKDYVNFIHKDFVDLHKPAEGKQLAISGEQLAMSGEQVAVSSPGLHCVTLFVENVSLMWTIGVVVSRA